MLLKWRLNVRMSSNSLTFYLKAGAACEHREHCRQMPSDVLCTIIWRYFPLIITFQKLSVLPLLSTFWKSLTFSKKTYCTSLKWEKNKTPMFHQIQSKLPTSLRCHKSWLRLQVYKRKQREKNSQGRASRHHIILEGFSDFMPTTVYMFRALH